MIGSQLAVRGVVFTKRKKIGGACFCHRGTSLACQLRQPEVVIVSGSRDMC